MTDTFRALCAELLDEIPHESPLTCMARTALAQPAPPAEALAARPLLERVAAMGNCIGQHTVGEIMAISDRAAAWLRENSPGQPVAIEPRGCPTPGACSCVLPAPPADGEVSELMEWLRKEATSWADLGEVEEFTKTSRIADLLAQRHPAPVPVSERLPCAEDCDAEGRCWFHSVGRKWCDWYLLKASCATETETHWLPFHALPLPAGEVQP